MTDEALRLDIGMAAFFLLLVLVGWIGRKAKDVLPDPDRSTKRNAQLADEMDRRNKQAEKQG